MTKKTAGMIALLMVISPDFVNGEPGVIVTIAGGAEGGFWGDGGPVTEARLDRPNDITGDDQGNLYIASFGNNRVRKIDANGIITRIAGNGDMLDFPADNLPALEAGVYRPTSVLFDQQGRLLVAELLGRIRVIDEAGITRTIAGIPSGGVTDDGV